MKGYLVLIYVITAWLAIPQAEACCVRKAPGGYVFKKVGPDGQVRRGYWNTSTNYRRVQNRNSEGQVRRRDNLGRRQRR